MKEKPQLLYKYLPLGGQDMVFTKRLKQYLQEQKIWIADPEKFNDPFDCNIHFSGKEQFLRDLNF